ncbi:hypothetical protein A2524_01210 [Candidatus Wolfebacteria bacterium RIFOXYD12_FULL_48_21]|uniref:L,D-TPase catalytic domain-containing protein n=1 Tax=Candidatus Wolfebacteria bacterium RIFOXYD1_FULL_48_65 TaxID=1802561 RepID=A0A1F8E0D6_9BACT|nr:MAG: hypothetical protein A2610_03155 [Candidatus Wolfebacteria bacterium RIFOXYD1_FULL_48_65]OGM94426.1 MAG: hypothetical protein A2524_01210 [Candidatus Wolfebacteria bacterium RIFOXYD12_FULL_48_21]OGM97380.1 MAG: hypothetical protein A2532_01845 [Candidatus Wolfebacteria bacterium RIFOXYD2_FULL_48_11]
MQTIRTTTGILIATPLLFWGGWNIGKAVYPEPAQQLAAQSQVATLSRRLITMSQEEKQKNICAETLQLADETDRHYCFEAPKITEQKGAQIDLTTQKIILFENGKIVDILPVAYQSPENVWFQTPTGYFRVGFMNEKHRSSLFPVNMPYAIQITEDFFMHEIPFYDDGTKVTSQFSGGCLRFETDIAKRLFDFLDRGDQLVIYKTFGDRTIKPTLYAPVAMDQFWIRQRFYSPLRSTWSYAGNLDKLMLDYDEHAGVDLAPNRDATDLGAYAITDGTVMRIQPNDGTDHGMGATVIVEHTIDGKTLYGVYAHLASIAASITEGGTVHAGDTLGTVGNSAYGCQNNWKVGTDGCDSTNPDDIHLHFELKTKPVLENPDGGMACKIKIPGAMESEPHACYGYTPGDPRDYGYLDPIQFLFTKTN